MENKKSYNPQGDVESFMKACGQIVPSEPTIPDGKTLELRCRLLLEEVFEFVEGAGFHVTVSMDTSAFFNLDENVESQPQVIDRKKITLVKAKEPDMVDMYDAIVDINYVSYGAAAALGVPVEPGHEEVHRSNLTKVSPDGTVKKNEFGKVIKPPTFSPANLRGVLKRLGHKEE